MTVLSIFADAKQAEAEKWIAPILTSIVNLAATYFAFMSSRDRLRYDAHSQITTSRMKQLEIESEQCKKEAKILRRRLNRVIANLQSQMLGQPLPFPKELGFSEDNDQNDSKAG